MALLLFCIMLYCIGGISSSITYHRILTHRMASLPRAFRKILIVLALPLGTPVQWVGTHRQHHRFADKTGDPHSPLIDGFWYAHCGWYLGTRNIFLCLIYASLGVFRIYFDGYWRPRSNQEYIQNAVDIQKNAFCAFVSRKLVYQWLMWIYASVLIGTAYCFFGANGIIATWFTLVLVYNLGDSVNSLGHLKGARGALHHNGRNNAILAYFAFGEGWHADHHDRADQVNFGKGHKNTDLGYSFMRLFSLLGLLRFTKKVE